MSHKTLLIVDGNALVHRAWHALPPLTSPDGRVVSGAYGFMSILLRALREIKPEFVAVTFDLAGPTFRHEAYVEYKATREKKPDELYEQIPIIHEILETAGIPHYSMKGFEADDVIGTICARVIAETKDIDCLILTGDNDAMQLVNDRVRILTFRKGISDTVTYDIAGVIEKFGLRPDQMIDYKALRGDVSDNIPGVRGIGEKTATDLLQKYGNLEALYEAVRRDDPEIKSGVLAKLKDGVDAALQAQDLCRIRTDVKFDFDVKDTELVMPTKARLDSIFRSLGFFTLLKQLPDSDSLPMTAETKEIVPSIEEKKSAKVEGVKKIDHEAAKEKAFIPVTNDKSIKEMVSKLKKSDRFAFRILRSADAVYHRPEIVAVSFFDGDDCYLLRREVISNSAISSLSALMSSATRKVCHNYKEEILALWNIGIEVNGEVTDIMLGSYLLDPGTRAHDLGRMISHRLGIEPLAKDADEEEKILRLSLEVEKLLMLSDEVEKEIKQNDLESVFRDIDMPTAPVLARMERVGVKLNSDYLGELSDEIGTQIKKLEKTIYDLAGAEFNINSPSQMKEILFEKLLISTAGIKKTAKGGTLSTAAAELEKIQNEHEIIRHILEYRELSKLKSTYIDSLPVLADKQDGRIHAKFNQAVTATGRLSSSDPNLQNIPSPTTDNGRRVRNAFCAERGYTLVAADYSQVELRFAAHLSGEQSMIDAFKNGEDIHYRTAAAMFGEENAKEKRKVAKVINFGIIYGMGPQMLSQNAGVSFNDAREYIKRYFEIHPKIAEFTKSLRQTASNEGIAETLYGRKRFFRDYHMLDKREQGEAERQAVNMPFQGSQADMIKVAMIRLDKDLRKKWGGSARMIIQVHDELVFEVKDELVDEVTSHVRKVMEGIIKLKVPLVVDIEKGKRWGEMR